MIHRSKKCQTRKSFPRMKRSLEDKEEHQDETDLYHRISQCCYEQFNLLPTRGKPSSNEWTHLAAFVSVDTNDHIRVLSIGTGTKCLGGSIEEKGTNGCLLHDSHAEVIARRALLRFFYDDILSKKDSLLVPIENEENKYRLKDSTKLYLFVTYPPCGQAAYVSEPIKRPKLEHKSLHSTSLADELYLKPGKGSATTSLSCTNKIKRWIFQGLEGTLLNQIISSPVRLSALIIVTESDLTAVFHEVPVKSIRNPFEYGPSKDRIRPSSISMAWWITLDVSSPVLTVDGYPLGQIRRLRAQQKYANPLSKVSLFRLYLQIKNDSSDQKITYAQAKNLSSNSLRNEFLQRHPQWTITDPNIFYSFTVDSFS